MPNPKTSGIALLEPKMAALILADGTVFSGYSFGESKKTFGEICFNTAMTGYQEILSDPSYAGQIITFTFPHIGNVGANDTDIEFSKIWARGMVTRTKPTLPSNFRSEMTLDDWCEKNNIAGIYGVDTRALTRHIRQHGAQNCCIVSGEELKVKSIVEEIKAQPSMKGLDLAKDVTSKKIYEWKEPVWSLNSKLKTPKSTFHVVAIDYGCKQNILRLLVSHGCKVMVVPAQTSAEDIIKLKPDGVFLSNGPGDPAATGTYAIPTIKALLGKLPIFGICLGHQMLGIALGGKTEKMKQGHRGANHPVQDLRSKKVEITSQNHGFVVSDKDLPESIEVTHRSLFDGTVQGIRAKNYSAFSVQGHPEASPGPHDTHYIFAEFIEAMKQNA